MKINIKFGTTTVLMAILLVSLAVIPAASASSGNEATSASAVFTPAIESLKDAGILTTYNTTYYITAGQTRNYIIPVGAGKHFLDPDLTWTPLSSLLRLTVTSPTGQVYGPWTDISDGRLDGRIHFANPPIQFTGLTTGNWTFTVCCGSGSATYSFTVTVG